MRAAVVVALVAALALSADATGKRWAERVEACGGSGCARIDGERASRVAQLAKTLEGWAEPFWPRGPRSAPYYRFDVDRGTRRHWSFLYVPSAQAIRIDDRRRRALLLADTCTGPPR